MRIDKLLLSAVSLIRYAQNIQKAPRRTFLLSTFFALLIICSFGCAPTSSPVDGRESGSASTSNDLPEITDEILSEEINDSYVREVPEGNGAGETISWSFDRDEPKEYTIVEKQMNGDSATITLDIKTSSAPRSRAPKFLAGRIRTKWKLETGWALRKWEIVETENISMKYKNLPKPIDQNSNSNSNTNSNLNSNSNSNR